MQNSKDSNNIYYNNNNLQNSKNSEGKINIIIPNIDNNNFNHHHEGYERHYGKEEKCPVCKNMKKRSQFMEDRIFGQEQKKFISRPFIKDFKTNIEPRDKFNKKMMEIPKKEEEKNLYNNNNTQGKSKLNSFKETQTRFYSKRNQSMKNFYKKNDSNQSLSNINYGNLFEVQFPAINSYFHS